MSRPARRRWLGTAAAALLVPWLDGCASAPDADAGAASATASAGEPLLSRWRTMDGGFLAPPSPVVGLPSQPGTGMFVKWVQPTAVAMRGSDLLLLDAAAGRLWRADTALNTLTGIAGAPTVPDSALALGPDLSAWVLAPGARQVLRFGPDSRLLQTWPIDTTVPSPVALALADGGATLLLGDGMGAQWAEQRSPSAPLRRILPVRAGGERISGVDGLATVPGVGRGGASDLVWVLDRLGGVVHRVQRDGQVVGTLGRGDLLQPVAIAADRFERVFVVDRQGQSLVCLQAGSPAQRWAAADLGVQEIGGLATDDRLLALSDRRIGRLVMLRIGRPPAP
ncbi:MAG: hypothetical protein JNL87_13710 [Burkholderiaceae bacterium]|nr:hypothetical protein [Burkholderiaceae bacterium]